MLSEGNDSEGEDMYGFLPKNKLDPKYERRVENIYETRKPVKVVTFKNEPPRVRIIQRRHSCAENFRNYQQTYYRSPYVANRTPSYPPAIKRSNSFVESACAHYHRRPLPTPPQMRPPPPSYNVAVRRAASFSATRGVKGGFPRRPPPPVRTEADGSAQPTNLNRVHSSSTSDLYVDSFSLKRAPSREILSAASSTSSISEATVYKKIGPGDYVSVSDKTFHRKSFKCETTSGARPGPLIYVPVCVFFR